MPEVESGAAAAAPEPAAIANTSPPSIEDTMGDVFDKLNPDGRVNRSDDGKFVSKTPAEVAPAETAQAAEVSEQEPVAETTEPARPAIQRPQSYSSDLDDWWNSLPPERQEFLSKRESDAHKRITELGETAKSIEPIRQAIEPLRQIAQRIGVTEAELTRRTAEVHNALEQNPVGAIKWLADSYGVDLSKFAKPAGEGEQPESAQITALHQQIAQLQRQIGETNHKLTSREQQEAQSRLNARDQLVNDFSTGKDYWPDIEQEVIQQVIAIRSTDPDKDDKTVLQEAHDRAIKLNEAVSKKLNEAKVKADAEKKAAEDKRKADEAKKLASLNVKSSSGKSPASSKSLEDEMAEIYDKVASRA
jgi:transcriptional regulator with XRE-family HTH domain